MAFPSLSQWESLSYPCFHVAVQRVELNARVSLTTLVTTGSKRVSNLHKNAVSVPLPHIHGVVGQAANITQKLLERFFKLFGKYG